MSENRALYIQGSFCSTNRGAREKSQRERKKPKAWSRHGAIEGFMSCLDDRTILDLIRGGLDDVARRRVEEELARCAGCAALVGALLRESSAPRIERSGAAGPRSNAQRCGEWIDPGTTIPVADDADHTDPDSDGGAAARYALGEVIARGGMGTIVSAFDRKLDRTVAIKCLDAEDVGLTTRFAREIRVTAALQHPGIVPIYDSGLLPDGRRFYAMRHVPGTSLEHEIEHRTSADAASRERMALLVPVLAAVDAVAYAHERGVIHRDLKPSNILLGPFGETVVIDWGLARIERERIDDGDGEVSVSDPGTTRLGAVLGTPRYMAPEQARGEPASLPCDVYALGAILYHAISGAPPVDGHDVNAVLAQVARAEVAPLHRIAPGVPGDLVAIIERAMALRPAERYPSAGALADDLRRFQTGQLVAAYSYSRRHRGALLFAALCALVIAIGATVSIRRIVVAREHAETQQGIAERQRAGAEDLVHFLLYDLREKLKSVGRLDVLSGVADRVESYYQNAGASAAQPESLRARAELYNLRAQVASNAGDGTAADRLLAQGLAVIERVPPSSRADEVRAGLLETMATRAGRQRALEKSRGLYVDAQRVRRRIAPTDPGQRRRNDFDLIYELSNGAVIADRMGLRAEADREWQEAKEIAESYRKRDPDDAQAGRWLAQVQMVMGQSRMRRSELRGARAPLESAVAIFTALTERQPRDAQFHSLLAAASLALADVAAAEDNFDEARRLRETARASALVISAIEPASGSWQSVLAQAETGLGATAMRSKDWPLAVQHLEAARTLHEQLMVRDPSNREARRAAAVTTAELAAAASKAGQIEDARAAWSASLSSFEQLSTSNPARGRLEWANGLRLYAAFERAAGRAAIADRSVAQASALADSTPPMTETPIDHYYRAGVLLELGRAHAANRRERDAQAAWRRGAELLREVASKLPLESDSVELLQELDAELGRRAHRGVQ
jgi:tetratricopeptide (TPR) repeat protein